MRVLCNPKLCEIFALQLVRKLKEAGIEKVDWVVGSPCAGITFSYEVAKTFNAVHAFPEKDPSDPNGKRMIWRRIEIPKGADVLQIEELITTSGTFKEVRQAIDERNSNPVNWISEVGALVHRPPKLPVDYDGREVIALIETEVWAVEQKDCQLCKVGSPRYRPKANWKKLTGKA